MKNIIRAVFTLSFFSILDRLLGFVFKIYLSRELGAASMGVYQVALSIFFVLLTFTSSGIPLVISKLTAKYRQNGDRNAEYSAITAAVVVGLGISIFLSIVIIVFKGPFSRLLASDLSMLLLLMLLPALIFSSIYSALRGSFWGRQKYLSVSLLEIFEQVARITICVILFSIGLNKLRVTVLSLSIACALSALACVVMYFIEKNKLKNPKGYILPLIKSASPITVSRAASSIVNSVIAITVPFLLISSGLSKDEAMYAFGYSVGMALPLLYIPLTMVGSLAFALIPTLALSIEKGNKRILKNQIEKAISFSIIIAFVFFPFFTVLGEEVGIFIYNNADSGKFLAMSSWLLIPLAVESITSSMMNSLDLEMRSFINYFIGSIIMFISIFVFYKNFSIEVLSISMGINWSVASLLDIITIRKKTKINFKFLLTILKCLLVSFPAALIARLTYNATYGLSTLLGLAISGTVSALFVILLVLVFDMVDIDIFKSKKAQKPQSSQQAPV